MERLTKPGVAVEPTAAQFMGAEIKMENLKPRLLDLILNGPTLNAVNKDVLRHMIRQLYDRLQRYEDTGLTPEQIRNAQETLQCFDNIGIKRGNEIVTAEEGGRLVILPFLPNEEVWDYSEFFDGTPYAEYYKLRDSFIGVGISANGKRTFEYDCFTIDPEQIGKTIFLTREEAEAALEAALEAMNDA